jgi:predicted GNAT superfamily acetyltransferase
LQSRNAHFNLNRLGVTVRNYAENFYGTDYVTDPSQKVDERPGIDSDRLIAEWELRSRRVEKLADGAPLEVNPNFVTAIAIPANWSELLHRDIAAAKREQLRVRDEFKRAFAAGLVCAGFERTTQGARYLFYDSSDVLNSE